jgi:hypothetical protein
MAPFRPYQFFSFSLSPTIAMKSYVREDNSTVNEDVWFCNQTMKMIASSTRPRASDATPWAMVPAPHYEAVQFSVETEMHAKPFGVHAFWFHLQPNYEMRVGARDCMHVYAMQTPAHLAFICTHFISYQTKALFEACPEALEIIPEHFCDHWHSAVCAAHVNRTTLIATTECDWTMCTGTSSKELHGAGMLYEL